jgi:hypothetical protein
MADKNWKTKLRDTKKANIEKIISWYESGVEDDRYSLKDLSKPERDLYKTLLKNVFNNCKDSTFQQALMNATVKIQKDKNNADASLSMLLLLYITKHIQCGKLKLSIKDLFTYFNIFKKEFDTTTQSLFSAIKLNEILNSGKYGNLVKIFIALQRNSETKFDFFNLLVLSLYKKYYENFTSDEIFDNEKNFWDTYLNIVTDYPFKKVNPSSPLTIPDSVYDSIALYIKNLTDNKEKMEVLENFLLASKNAASSSTNWNIKLPVAQQFYDFLDNQTKGGKRVFYTYKFRDDLDRTLDNGEVLQDNELEAIDKCLTNDKKNFSTFIEYLKRSGNKSKKELFEEYKKFGCPKLEVPKSVLESSPATGANTGPGEKAAAAVTNAAKTAASAATGAATAVEEAAKGILARTTDTNSKNAVFSSDEFVNNILPDLQVFISLNNTELIGKNIDEVIDFIIKADEQPLSKFVEQYKDNQTLKTFIKTIIGYESKKVGCPITLQRIQMILKTYAKQQRCIIPKGERKPDTFLSIKEVDKEFPELFENSKLYRVISGSAIEGMIYINQGDEFNKFTEECRVKIAKLIYDNIQRCNQDDFKNLSNIFKININGLIYNPSKKKYDLYEYIYSGSKDEVVFLRNGDNFYVVSIDGKMKNPVGTFNSAIKDKPIVETVLKEEIKDSSEIITVQTPSVKVEIQQQPGQAPTTEVKTDGQPVLTGEKAEEMAWEELKKMNLGPTPLSRFSGETSPTSLLRTSSFTTALENENENNGDSESLLIRGIKTLGKLLLFGEGRVPYNADNNELNNGQLPSVNQQAATSTVVEAATSTAVPASNTRGLRQRRTP